MGDYIKREDALHALCVDCAARHIFKRGLKCSNDAACKVFDRVSTLPAADVRENVRGYWIADEDDVKWGNSLIKYRCSNCGKRPFFDKTKRKYVLTNCCPNCGVDMRG